MIGTIVFTIFASGQIQPWAHSKNDTLESEPLMKGKDIECAKEELEQNIRTLKEIDKSISYEKDIDTEYGEENKLKLIEKQEGQRENIKDPT